METTGFIRKVKEHWPKTLPVDHDLNDVSALKKSIVRLLREKNAVLIAHYYTDPLIQQLAEETGGFIGDSLEMARFGAEHAAAVIVVAGVRFMGETAKILCPDKLVLMPAPAAECSLDLGCEPEKFRNFIASNPGYKVVVYANTSAHIKAMADWVVTSSIAVDVVRHLHSCGEKILWAPDKYLGGYIQRQTGAGMLLWDACCVVHAEFDAAIIRRLHNENPDAEVLVHPEAPPEVVALADVVGSTSQLLDATKKRACSKYIVATEMGIFYKMQQASPHKKFIIAETSPITQDFACNGSCPWMKMNSLQNIHDALLTGSGEVTLPSQIIEKAAIPLDRMLEFKKGNTRR